MSEYIGACPVEYQDKPFLDAQDLMQILGVSENSVYRYLKTDLPFKTIKVGKLIRINARSFWSWYMAN